MIIFLPFPLLNKVISKLFERGLEGFKLNSNLISGKAVAIDYINEIWFHTNALKPNICTSLMETALRLYTDHDLQCSIVI